MRLLQSLLAGDGDNIQQELGESTAGGIEVWCEEGDASKPSLRLGESERSKLRLM